MPPVPPIDVAGKDTVSNNQANSAMARMQREAKKVCVEREDDMPGKLISPRPPRSTEFCPVPDGCAAIGHICLYLIDSLPILRRGYMRKVCSQCPSLDHHVDDARLGSSSAAVAAAACMSPCISSRFGVALQQLSHGRLELLQTIRSSIDSLGSDRFFQHGALLGHVFFTEHQ